MIGFLSNGIETLNVLRMQDETDFSARFSPSANSVEIKQMAMI